jgi:hypothetical protein
MYRPKTTTFITLLLSLPLLVILVGLATETLPPPAVFAQANGACPALPPPTGNVVHVSTVAALKDAVNSATSDTTILIADGTYHFGGSDYCH